MKFAALALSLLCACSLSAASSEERVRYTVTFAPGSDEAALRKVVEVYKQRLGKLGSDTKFGTDSTSATVTAEMPKPGPSDETFVREVLESQGEFEFLEEAQKEFLVAHDTTLEGEHARYTAWRKTHADARMKEFDSVARADGGPLPGTLWRRLRSTKEDKLLLRPEEARFRFTNKDVASTGFSQDQYGYPAVNFELSKERQQDFSDWTNKLIGKGMAIVRDDEILVLANVRSRLPGSGIIEGGSGGFTKEEVTVLQRLLSLPPLPLPPLSLKSELLH